MKSILQTVGAWRREFRYRLHQPRSVVFAHLPKCAGTTITRYLMAHYPDRLIFRTHGLHPYDSVRAFQQFPRKKRHRYRLVAGHGTAKLLDRVRPDAVAAIIFRDPVERVISHYYFVHQKQAHYLHEELTQSGISLADYPTSGLTGEVRNWYTCYLGDVPVEEAESNPNAAVERASAAIEQQFDLIGFQDALPSFVAKLQQRAGLHLPFDDKVRNPSKQRPRHVDADTRRAIAEANELDVELFRRLRTRMDRALTKSAS